ncbi:unnamed protein product [Vitrella brassicaformis CCMP3155]|uniref:Tetratricopeptide repeat protein 29 n=3 Tax=Vitrella brassicaformis TaxID=1169539 RepID=A0A0G4G4F7_VITBC|nr:unnamed protein product [Vitrella brassicaformis CCMP3155]|eukprot:CEM23234.1 unnamed protein product [Vitrella brassicaformis CCMP3155]
MATGSTTLPPAYSTVRPSPNRLQATGTLASTLAADIYDHEKELALPTSPLKASLLSRPPGAQPAVRGAVQEAPPPAKSKIQKLREELLTSKRAAAMTQAPAAKKPPAEGAPTAPAAAAAGVDVGGTMLLTSTMPQAAEGSVSVSASASASATATLTATAVGSPQQLCVELLLAGCVQSFIDFFVITHSAEDVMASLGERAGDAAKPRRFKPVEMEKPGKGPVSAAPASQQQQPAEGISTSSTTLQPLQTAPAVPEETLVFLKETLESAETARRLGPTYLSQCFEQYRVVAEYFEKIHDLDSARYFHRRCGEVVAAGIASKGGAGAGGEGETAGLRECLAKSLLSLGICDERTNNWASAKEHHEQALRVASAKSERPGRGAPATAGRERGGPPQEGGRQSDEEVVSLPLMLKSASRLVEVYKVLAAKCEREGRYEAAAQSYERCVECARLSRDSALEGTACYNLGKAKLRLGSYHEAAALQQQYLDICRTHGDRVGESAARASLAQAQQALGNTQEAVRQLEQLLAVANEAGELDAQTGACLNLGLLYSQRAEYDKAVDLLEQHFDLARQLGDRKLIDSARVLLGVARGNGKLTPYIDVIGTSLDRLLKWKSRRVPIDQPET